VKPTPTLRSQAQRSQCSMVMQQPRHTHTRPTRQDARRGEKARRQSGLVRQWWTRPPAWANSAHSDPCSGPRTPTNTRTHPQRQTPARPLPGDASVKLLLHVALPAWRPPHWSRPSRPTLLRRRQTCRRRPGWGRGGSAVGCEGWPPSPRSRPCGAKGVCLRLSLRGASWSSLSRVPSRLCSCQHSSGLPLGWGLGFRVWVEGVGLGFRPRPASRLRVTV
jgi:hypothetical protein